MNNETKLKIQELLIKYCDGFDSNNKAANSLRDVSAGTISQVINNKWDLISDKMWLNIGKQVGLQSSKWVIVETTNYGICKHFLNDAKQHSRVHAIIGSASYGKDTSAKDFVAENDSVYLINCSEFFNKKYFLVQLLRAMGENTTGTLPELVERAVSKINRTDRPVIIFNEADKLNDPTLYFFITFYNLCEDKCGLVMMATEQLINRISRGMFLGRKGYQEIFSRLGRRFIELKETSKADVTKICMANGVTSTDKIAEIFNKCEGDLRRVKKLVQNEAMKGEQAA